MLKYKYIISLEGNDKDSGLNWKLASNSLVLMPIPKFESWLMEGKLKPWIHFVPIKDDYSDLSEKLEYCVNNDSIVKQIVINANNFMKQFKNFNKEVILYHFIINYYKDRFNFID